MQCVLLDSSERNHQHWNSLGILLLPQPLYSKTKSKEQLLSISAPFHKWFVPKIIDERSQKRYDKTVEELAT